MTAARACWYVVSTLLAGMYYQAAAQGMPDHRASPPDSLDHIYQAPTSGLKHPLRAVVYDSATFAELWSALMRNRGASPLRIPKVDFTRDMLVVAAMGFHSTSGGVIRIVSARHRDAVVRVTVVLESPEDGCTVSPAAQYPVDIVRLPKSVDLVTFADQFRSYPCR